MSNREARTLLPRQQWAEPPGARRPAARGGDASGMLPVSRLRPVRLLVCPPWTCSPGSGLPACAPALNAKACPSGEPGTDHTAAWKPTLWRPPRAVSFHRSGLSLNASSSLKPSLTAQSKAPRCSVRLTLFCWRLALTTPTIC